MFRRLVHALHHAIVVIEPEVLLRENTVVEEAMPARGVELPLELWAPITDDVAAAYLDEVWMALPEQAGDTTVEENAAPNTVHSLLHVSFNARHATLRSLAHTLGLTYDNTHAGRLSADPQARIAALRTLWSFEPLAGIQAAVAALAAHSPTCAAYAHLVSATRHVRAVFALLVADAAAGGGVDALRALQPGMKAAVDFVFGARFAAGPRDVAARLEGRRRPVFVLAVNLVKAALAAHQYLHMCRAMARARQVPLERAPYEFPAGDEKYERIIRQLTDCLVGVPPAYRALQLNANPRGLMQDVRRTVGADALAVATTLLADAARVEGPGERYAAVQTGAARAGQVVGFVVGVGG